MSDRAGPTQSAKSIERNTSFFKDNLSYYDKNISKMDTYAVIRRYVTEALRGTNRLLDIGNGGVFDYDATVVGDIIALDLFLDALDPSVSYPDNVSLRKGSALDIPEPDGSFDGVLLSMLLHHLTGKTAGESFMNIVVALKEAFRVLEPGGKMIVLESCVPPLFYSFEKMAFPLASRLIEAVISHPATLQYPAEVLAKLIENLGPRKLEMVRVPKGRWILLLGFKYPAKFVPIDVYRFIAYK